MKVNIGPYINYWGPYQIADLLQKLGVSEERCYAIGRWLADKIPVLNTICQWIYDKRKRTVKVHIDDYDVWSMDSTLKEVILPMLKKLKEKKQASAMVDDEDVPLHLRCPNIASNETMQLDLFECEETDTLIWNSYHKKWDYVLDEVIWAFEQKDSDWEDQYWITKPEFDLENYEEDEGKEIIPVRWKVKGECDWKGRMAHQERISNGFRLFGKYFEGLWW